MTRAEKWLTGLVCALLCAFVAEHVYLIVDTQRHPPQLVEACPVPKPIHPPEIKP